jgi:hypothetical protein
MELKQQIENSSLVNEPKDIQASWGENEISKILSDKIEPKVGEKEFLNDSNQTLNYNFMTSDLEPRSKDQLVFSDLSAQHKGESQNQASVKHEAKTSFTLDQEQSYNNDDKNFEEFLSKSNGFFHMIKCLVFK